MAGSQKRFQWNTGTLGGNLKGFTSKSERAIAAAVEFQATRSEAYMRQNAPWNDQTGNARNGLHTTTFHEVGGTHGIVCAHSMPYGIWLEVKFSGRDGIIPATVRNGGDALMTLLSKLFGDVIEVH